MKTAKIDLLDASRFSSPIDFTNAEKIAGTYRLNEVTTVKYSIGRQDPTAEYCLRGSVSLLDPASGKVYQKRGKKVKEVNEKRKARGLEPISTKNAHPDELCARRSVVLKTLDAEAVKKKIVEAAQKFYLAYAADLELTSQNSVSCSDMSYQYTISTYLDRYLAQRTPSNDMRAQYRQMLTRAGQFLPAVAIEKLTIRDVEKMRSGLGETWRKYVYEACRFLDFVFALKKNSCIQKNVFTLYMERNPTGRRKSAETLQKKAVVQDDLSTEEERRLNQMILEHREEGLWIGVLLVKDGGLSAREACRLRWCDIQFDLENREKAQVHLQKDDNAGATHNYSFLLFPFAALVLRDVYDELCKKFTAEQATKLPLVPDKKDRKKPMDPKILTGECRNILQQVLQEPYLRFAAVKDTGKGAGITLLHHTYERRLTEECGLDTDPTIVSFLEHKVLSNSVLADHYRSFTDATAQHNMYVSLRRDQRFGAEKTNKKNISREKMEEGEAVSVAPADVKRKSRVTCIVRMKPGATLTVLSAYGCKLSAEAAAVSKKA